MLTNPDEVKTQLMTKANWLAPVERVDQLPTHGVSEGTRCFVDADDAEFEEVWEFKAGAWVLMDTL